MAKVISFGYDFGGPPKEADHVEDVRNSAYKPEHWKSQAMVIAHRAKKAKVIAIGDKHGHTRAPKIADRVAVHLDGAAVTHRDLHKPRLLRGQRGENIRSLQHQGMSEEAAVSVAAKHDANGD